MVHTEKTQSRAASGYEARAILGPLDDKTIETILATGANADEIRQALEWLEDDCAVLDELTHMGPAARRVCVILLGREDDPVRWNH